MLRILSLLALATPAVAANKPNVVIVMTDDNGTGDFSFTGNPVVKTPNFDAFAKESVRLTDFHVCPMCSPTRGQLLTGLAAVRNGATSVTAGRTFLRPGLPTMAEVFAANGYNTGLFGKWHLGDLYPHRPIDKGFRTSVYHLGWGMLQSTPEAGNPLIDGRYFHNGEPKQFKGHCTDFWFEAAQKWIGECQKKNEPFLCYIPTNAPHAPHTELDQYVAPYKGKGPAAFFGMIAHLDDRFGRLMTFLRDSDLMNDTIVIYMTDNGGTSGVQTFNAGLRASKTTYYDGGHRVPCWVRWPNGKLGEPRDIDTPTQNTDLLPTLIDWCGLTAKTVPAIPKAEFELFGGTSLSGLFQGKPLPERTLVVQYGQIVKKYDACVIRDQWRLVKGEELYDIRADRAQKTNLAAAKPEVVKSLRDYYDRWWAAVEPVVNEFVPNHIGAKAFPTVELTSADWEGIYADNLGYVRSATGGPTGSHWHVQVETAGTYRFNLYRWPTESKVSLGGKLPVNDRYTAYQKMETKDFPTIAGAKVKVADLESAVAASPADTNAVLTLKLPAGRTTLKAWFQDAAGKDLCGAFYVVVTKVD